MDRATSSTRARGEEVNAHCCQLGRREFALIARICVQSGFTDAIQEYGNFHQVLVRESMGAVIGDGRGLLQVRGRKLGR